MGKRAAAAAAAAAPGDGGSAGGGGATNKKQRTLAAMQQQPQQQQHKQQQEDKQPQQPQQEQRSGFKNKERVLVLGTRGITYRCVLLSRLTQARAPPVRLTALPGAQPVRMTCGTFLRVCLPPLLQAAAAYQWCCHCCSQSPTQVTPPDE
jgi:hypothetical protein